MPDPALVAARLRRLDAEVRAAVLADCREARGESVEREGAAVRVERGGETVTVATRDDDGADRVADVAAVRDLLCYGVARGDADQIAERHLGAPLDDLRPPLPRRVAARASALAAPAALLALVVTVVAAGVVVGGAGPDETPAPPAATASTGTVATTVPPTPVGGRVAPEASQVPGVGVGGVSDREALADAHGEARPDSYVVQAQVRRVASDYDVVTRNVTLRADGDRYRAAVVTERAGERTGRATVYGNSDARWVGTQGEDGWTVERLAVNETGPASVDPVVLGPTGVRNALATPETEVSGPVEYGGRTAYRVVGTGVPVSVTDAVRTYRVVAHVRPDGFVYAVRINYTLIGPRLSDRSLEWQYVEAGTTVETPFWHPEMGKD